MISDTTVVKTLQDDIGRKLGLHELEEEERNLFLQNVAELVIESATLRYVIGISPEQREVFESWLELHEHDENLLEEALKIYPDYADLVAEEVEAFRLESMKIMENVH